MINHQEQENCRKRREIKKWSATVYSYIDQLKGWEYFKTIDIMLDEINGKYLFFSYNRDLLVDLAINELKSQGFHHAKINLPPPVEEYVLCLYYKDDSRKHELARRYKKSSQLKYRYWKSNDDTRLGRYSKEFLEKQNRQINGENFDS